LHESSAVGIAAGYVLITGKPSVVSLHTYPGLANGHVQYAQCAYGRSAAAVDQRTADSRFLIHNPVLAKSIRLAQLGKSSPVRRHIADRASSLSIEKPKAV
jgi:benzoylformate decarboxylase